MQELEFKMPKLGESITEAAIIKWFKGVGDTVEHDEILLEVATDKVDAEVPSTVSGEILELRFQPNDVVAIGEVIAVIKTNGEAPNKAAAKEKSAPTKATTDKVVPKENKSRPTRASSSSFKVNENIYVSPLVDSMAREHHISYEELARIPATGKDGRLRKSDVLNYLQDGRPFQFVQVDQGGSGFKVPDLQFDKGSGKIVEMDRMRQMIADRMVFSKHTSPHVTAYVEADLTEMVQWRNENKVPFQKKYNEKLTYTPLFIEAISKAIQDFPMINSSLDGTNIIVKDEINIGMATALPSGNLIVPVVKNADKKNLVQLAATTNELVAKARNGELKGDDIKGSTFTISNVGTFGSLMGTPIINQPEAAILATGIIKKRAEVMEKPEGDTIEIRSIMYLSLSFDHRVVDGYLAGSFLRKVADYLEQFDVKRKI